MIIKQASKIGRTSYKEKQLGTIEEHCPTAQRKSQAGLSQAVGLQSAFHSFGTLAHFIAAIFPEFTGITRPIKMRPDKI